MSLQCGLDETKLVRLVAWNTPNIQSAWLLWLRFLTLGHNPRPSLLSMSRATQSCPFPSWMGLSPLRPKNDSKQYYHSITSWKTLGRQKSGMFSFPATDKLAHHPKTFDGGGDSCSSLRNQGQEESYKFKASLSSIVRLSLKISKKPDNIAMA